MEGKRRGKKKGIRKLHRLLLEKKSVVISAKSFQVKKDSSTQLPMRLTM
jgi:hypothetical protein